MIRLTRALTIAAVLATIVGGASGQEAPSSLRKVKLKSSCADFAFDPKTGSLLGIDPATGKATLYTKAYLDGKSTDAVAADVGGGQPAVLHKRYKDKSYFVVMSARGALRVLDTKGLKLVKKIDLRTGWQPPRLTGAPDPSDPYVYYFLDYQVVGLSLETFRLDMELELGSGTPVPSADGKTIYLSGSRGTSVHVRRKDPSTGKTQWHEAHRLRKELPSYLLPDPFGLSVACSDQLYSADLKRKLAKLDFRPRCFFPNRPVIVGTRVGKVVLASYNNYKVYIRVPLPAGFKEDGDEKPRTVRTDRNTWPVIFAARYFADPAGGRVVLAFEDTALVLSLKDMKVPDEPLLYCKLDVAEPICVGKAATIKLKLADARGKVQIKAGPKGMKLSGEKIVWTPVPAQAGRPKLTLRVHHKSFERIQTFQLKVEHPHVKLAFVPTAISTSPDGRRAVAWTAPSRDRWRRREEADEIRSHVALIDAETKKLLASKKLLYQIDRAAVDDHYVYVVPSEADRIDLLSLKDLSRVKRSHTDSRPRQIIPISPKLALVLTAESAVAYSLPEFKPTSCNAYPRAKPASTRPAAAFVTRPERYAYGYRRPAPEAPQRTPRGWYASGCIFGPKLAKARMFVNCRDFAALAVSGERPALVPWGRRLDGETLLTTGGRRIGALASRQTVILDDHPVAVSLVASSEDSERLVIELVIQDLVSGKSIGRVRLLDERVKADRYRRYTNRLSWREGTGMLLSAGRKVFALIGNQLFIHTIADGTLKRAGVPFGLVGPAKVTIISATGKTTIKHALRGGQKPFEFELTGSRKGMEIDSKTGTVTIDAAAMLDEVVARAVDGLEISLERIARQRGLDKKLPKPELLVASATQMARARLKQLTGRTTKGMPVLLPLIVAASDKDQRAASLGYQVVLDVPRERIAKAAARIVEEIETRRKQEELRRAEMERRYRERAGITTRPAADGKRIKDLEKRVAALEAKLDLLMELLKAKGK